MRCIVCGRTEDGVAKRSREIAAQINKALEIITNKEEIEALLQRKKKFDRITFTHVTISDEVLKILEKYSCLETSNDKHGYLICMHCKLFIDTMAYEIAPKVY
ncbi:MAG: hypothetical protein LBB48_01555 [Treponema sp.]|jgi:hypothetical protein|nr:hypothetical protein [Treponema sp.]